MNRRLLLAVGVVLVLVGLSGCLGFGGTTSEAGLHEDATYDWETGADVTIDLDGGSYTAVLRLDGHDEIRLYQRTRYGTEHPISVRGVQFQYPNGTVVNASEIDVRETRNSVYVTPPSDEGALAFTGSKQSKRFNVPVFVEGSWEVIVPEDHRVDNVVLATVRPGGYETEMVDDRVHITWSDLDSRTVRVDYYLARDLYLFGGLVAGAAIAGAIGIGYVYRQIHQLRREREELGLDFEIDDEDGPPPGRR